MTNPVSSNFATRILAKLSLPTLAALLIVSCQSQSALLPASAPAATALPATATGVTQLPDSVTAVTVAVVQTTAPTEVSPSGDVPDNAVFVSYRSKDGGYSIDYVEGWTVEPQAKGGVIISDKDSSEIVTLVPAPSGDINGYITTVDEPQLQKQAQDYKRADLTTVKVKVKAGTIPVLSYTWTSAPDPVTEKQLPVTSLRYYLTEKNGQLAILTLTTPNGVDNVDAFNQMLGSFTWSP